MSPLRFKLLVICIKSIHAMERLGRRTLLHLYNVMPIQYILLACYKMWHRIAIELLLLYCIANGDMGILVSLFVFPVMYSSSNGAVDGKGCHLVYVPPCTVIGCKDHIPLHVL